jgi:hypothetical protein
MGKVKEQSIFITYLATIAAIILWGFSFVWTNEILIREIPIFTFYLLGCF